MKVVVLGSGVVGVTTAYYLALAGHDVVVVDRQCGPALETSFGNAGEISPSYASPWAGPDIPGKVLTWLLMRYSPLVLRPKADWQMIQWMIATLGQCTAARYARNKSKMVRLANFSRQMLISLRSQTGIEYDHRTQGTLVLLRTQSQCDGIAKDVQVLKSYGVPFEILDQKGCLDVEPGLSRARDRFVGGLRLANDETGDCYKFSTALADIATAMGVRFLFDTTIAAIDVQAHRVTSVRTSRGPIQGDAYVVALGAYTPAMLRPLGLMVPVYPVKGYSLTAAITDETCAPQSTVMDESFKVATTRLGNRIRVGGMAELSGFTKDLPESRRATLLRSVQSLFPNAGDYDGALFWSGLRPMTPDGPPILGRTPIANLFLNNGHGTLGWTMACGSAKVLADIVSGQKPPIDVDDLSIARYGYTL